MRAATCPVRCKLTAFQCATPALSAPFLLTARVLPTITLYTACNKQRISPLHPGFLSSIKKKEERYVPCTHAR